ncbi:MAG: glycosyltransferase family 2 protein [Granulosicoccus sp.]|nr:glycosyltransferase family 2 protein [Granulosicoccus sp.]
MDQPVHTASRTSPERTPVTVIMCTCQGARHVEAQLRSLLAQTWPVRIIVADDASSDETVSRIRPWLRSGVDTLCVRAHNLGFVKNFEQTLRQAVEADAAYIALSDQDDDWHPDRIAAGMQALQVLEHEHGSQHPLLVHSDLCLIDEAGQPLHQSFLQFRRYRIRSEKSLSVIVGENGVMGNTILMNRALAGLALPFPENLHVHDYWLALLAELFGWRSLLPRPYVDYRLHSSNASNTAASMRAGWRGCWQRLRDSRVLSLDFKLPYKEDSRLPVLQFLLADAQRFPALDPDQRRELTAFVRYLQFDQPRLASLRYLLFSGVTRGSTLHRLRLCLATLLTRRYPRSPET